VPAALRKQGITSLSDNREGREVRLQPGALWLLFGDAVRERFTRPAGGEDDCSGSDRDCTDN
jgi:hypothetical protein